MWVHDLDPIAFQLGPLAVRWYGLAYLAGFICGLYYLKWLFKQFPVKNFQLKQLDDLLIWVVLGVVLGGRIGFTLFYHPVYYLANPLEILMIWQGGMSFHGGLVGVTLALWLFSRKHKINVFDLTDRIAPGVCFGLFFGRLANFINGELWGTPTNVTWAVVFPQVDDLPRHPSQLYEAALEGLILFVILHLTIKFVGMKRHLLPGIFLVGYGAFRFLVEFVRESGEPPLGGALGWITTGQLLSLPMVCIGVILIFTWVYRRN